MTRRVRQEWSTIEQVALAMSAWSAADQGGGQLLKAELQGVEGKGEGVDCRSFGNPRYLGPFPP